MPTQSLLRVPAAGGLAGCCQVAISVLQQNPPEREGLGPLWLLLLSYAVLHQRTPLPVSRSLPNRTRSACTKVKNETAGNYFSSSAGKTAKEKDLREGTWEEKKQKKNFKLLKRVCIDMYSTLTCDHNFVLVDTVICSKRNSRSMSACTNITEIAKYLPMQTESLEARPPFNKTKIKQLLSIFYFLPVL